jgi:putative secretion ATPase (PEP-CTERM system associated)
MYEEFYNLKEKPFQIVPNPEYLYLSPGHKNALTFLEYGLAESTGFVLLTGEIGAGKTTLIRYLLNQIESDMEVAVVFNTNVNSEQLLNLILQEFELEAHEDNKAKNLEILNNFLIGQYAERIRVLLIIDEAQNLTNDALEEVRMLSNVQSDDQVLMQIMLVGQPELRARLKTPVLVQFSQRIAVNYHLQALSREETTEFILFRLKKAGSTSQIFTSNAMEMIYQASTGIPRTINLICDSALVYGFADELLTIDTPVIETVINELGVIGLYDSNAYKAKAELPANITAQGDGFLHRLQMLEADVQKLQTKIDWHIGELENRTNGYKDELVAKLKDFVVRERKRSDRLLRQYTKLKMKFDALQKIHEKITRDRENRG